MRQLLSSDGRGSCAGEKMKVSLTDTEKWHPVLLSNEHIHIVKINIECEYK